MHRIIARWQINQIDQKDCSKSIWKWIASYCIRSLQRHFGNSSVLIFSLRNNRDVRVTRSPTARWRCLLDATGENAARMEWILLRTVTSSSEEHLVVASVTRKGDDEDRDIKDWNVRLDVVGDRSLPLLCYIIIIIIIIIIIMQLK